MLVSAWEVCGEGARQGATSKANARESQKVKCEWEMLFKYTFSLVEFEECVVYHEPAF